MSPSLFRFFSNHLELLLSLAGLLVIWVAPALFIGDVHTGWGVAAVTATCVGFLHGMIFWVVRTRQRRARSQTVWEIREMLEDRVRNQLAIAQMYLPVGPQAEAFSCEVEGIRESIQTISELVTSLDEHGLEAWKEHYAEALRESERPAEREREGIRWTSEEARRAPEAMAFA